MPHSVLVAARILRMRLDLALGPHMRQPRERRDMVPVW